MNPTLRQMRAFVAVAKTGNFTLAAQYMHVTQSALSGLIKELEQTLGVRVVDRSTRRIALTEIGHELYPLFSQMIDDLDRALANIADHAQLQERHRAGRRAPVDGLHPAAAGDRRLARSAIPTSRSAWPTARSRA